MSLVPIRRYRSHVDPFDRFFGDQLDLFDPWSDFDSCPTALTNRHHGFRWVNQPQSSVSSKLTQSSSTSKEIARPTTEKFRFEINVAGFNPDTVKTHVEGDKVVVEAKQEEKNHDGDYALRQIRRTYQLPEYADISHLVSYITPNNMLVAEVPINKPEVQEKLVKSGDEHHALAQFGQDRDSTFDYLAFLNATDFKPKIVNKGDNHKQLEMNVEMKTYQPEEIKVSVKNNQLIVQGEHKEKDKNHAGRSYFYKSTLLPPGTQFEHLKSQLMEDGHLKIEAPFVEQTKAIEGGQ